MAIVYTHQGKAKTTGRIKGSDTKEPNHIAFGIGSTAHAAGDTALTTERTTEARIAGVSSLVNTNAGAGNDTYQVVGTLTKSDAGTAAIQEAGLVDQARAAGAAVPAGDAWLMMGEFGALNIGQGDSIQFTMKVVFS